MAGLRRLWVWRKWFVGGLAVLMLAAAGYSLWQQFKPKTVTHGNYAPFANQQGYDNFYKQNPLYGKQAPTGARFSISSYLSRDKQPVYKITLFAPAFHPNNPNSAQNYITQLRQSQTEAKAWIKQQGVDPDKLYIEWVPDPDALTAPSSSPPPIPQR